MIEEAKENVTKTLDGLMAKGVSDWPTIKNSIRDTIGKFLWEKTGRRPMILPVIMEVNNNGVE